MYTNYMSEKILKGLFLKNADQCTLYYLCKFGYRLFVRGGLFANMFVRVLLFAMHICSQLNKHVHNTNQRKQLLCNSRLVIL